MWPGTANSGGWRSPQASAGTPNNTRESAQTDKKKPQLITVGASILGRGHLYKLYKCLLTKGKAPKKPSRITGKVTGMGLSSTPRIVLRYLTICYPVRLLCGITIIKRNGAPMKMLIYRRKCLTVCGASIECQT